jgi:endonuclease III-like uncharacterized protein
MDAMSIKPSVFYNIKDDQLHGFAERVENTDSSVSIADQTLVLSIRGLHGHWKQVRNIW